MSVAIVCQPGCDVTNFEIYLIFLIKPFILHDEKVKVKLFFIRDVLFCTQVFIIK